MKDRLKDIMTCDRTFILLVMLVFLSLQIVVAVIQNPISENTIVELTEIPDGKWYYQSARNFSNSPHLVPANFVWDYAFPPGYPIFLSLFMVSVHHVQIIILVQILIVCATIAFAFMSFRNIMAGVNYRVSTLLFAFNPLVLFTAFTFNTEIIAFLLITLSFYFFTLFLKGQRYSHLFLFAMCISTSNYFRISTVPLLLVIPLVFFFGKNTLIKKLTYAILFVLISQMALLPWRIRNLFFYDSLKFTASADFNFYIKFTKEVMEFDKENTCNSEIAYLDSLHKDWIDKSETPYAKFRASNPFKVDYIARCLGYLQRRPLSVVIVFSKNVIKSAAGSNMYFIHTFLGKNYGESGLKGEAVRTKLESFVHMPLSALLFFFFAVLYKLVFIVLVIGIFIDRAWPRYINWKLHSFTILVFVYVILISGMMGIARFRLPFLAPLFALLFTPSNWFFRRRANKTQP